MVRRLVRLSTIEECKSSSTPNSNPSAEPSAKGGVRGLILPVFRDYQEGRLSQLDLARGIEQAVQDGAHIINISGGERAPGGQADDVLARAVRRATIQRRVRHRQRQHLHPSWPGRLFRECLPLA